MKGETMHSEKCPVCEGSGKSIILDGYPGKECHACKGKGWVKVLGAAEVEIKYVPYIPYPVPELQPIYPPYEPYRWWKPYDDYNVCGTNENKLNYIIWS